MMVIDASKGVENQTRKLFKVCVMRHIPIFTFINKMDRDAKNPFDLVEEIEEELGIKTCPVNWPISSGKDFRGVYDRQSRHILAFTANQSGKLEAEKTEVDLEDESLKDLIGEENYNTLKDDVELLDGAGDELNLEEVQKGRLSPVFFGSALTNFGVEPFLEAFLQMTTPPLARQTTEGEVDPFDPDFSGFVFKIQANMNKAHRDRVAFVRICSGRFEKGMEVYHVQGNKKMKLTQPQQMMAQDREIVEEAYAGDILGLFDPGIFSIGDTLCAPGKKIRFQGIPTFAPEHFALISQKGYPKAQAVRQRYQSNCQEGAIQIFQTLDRVLEEVIVGVVGVLQFEVLEYRLKNEYGVEVRREGLPYQYLRWIENQDIDVKALDLTSDTRRVQDLRGRPLLLFTSSWGIDWALDHNKDLQLSEFGKGM